MTQAILSDYLWVPVEQVEQHHCIPYQYDLIDGRTKETYRISTYDDAGDAYRFPRGNLPKLKRVLGGIEWLDRRTAAPFPSRLRFTGQLYDEQKELVRRWLECGYGLVMAPPRSGKTLVATALMCRLRQRTLMLAHRAELCHQLEETIRRFTNVNELEEDAGQKLVGVLEEWDDFFPIATLSTYQCFAVSKQGRRVLREKRDYFGLVIVDECHMVSTELFGEVVNVTTAAYRCGLTATPTRKNGLHVIAHDALGPVVAVARTEQLPVQYTWEYTGIEVKPFSNWAVMWNRLVKYRSRDKQIARKVIEDVRAGHYCLVTTERLQHLDELKLAVQTIDPDVTVGLLSSRTKDRESFRNATKRGDYQVVIAMNKIVELGYNIPRWSCFHNTLPMANRENWYQRVSRIRTPMEPAFVGDDWKKPTPVARIWVDSGHPAVYAYKNIVKKENDRLGFECLTVEAQKRSVGKRKGLVGYRKESSK